MLSVESVLENLEITATNLRAQSQDIDDLEIQMVTIPQSGLNGQVDLKTWEVSLLVVLWHAVLRLGASLTE